MSIEGQSPWGSSSSEQAPEQAELPEQLQKLVNDLREMEDLFEKAGKESESDTFNLAVEQLKKLSAQYDALTPEEQQQIITAVEGYGYIKKMVIVVDN